MTIRILPDGEEIKQSAGAFQQPRLLFSNPKNLYQRRIKRLQELAKDNPLSDYLLFASRLVQAQLELLQTQPIPQEDRLTQCAEVQPLNVRQFPRSAIWRDLFKQLLAKMKPQAEEAVQATIHQLEQISDEELETMADHLLAQEFDLVSSDKALFIWAALSLYWLQLAQQLPRHHRSENAENLHICPVCASSPVASLVHFGSEQGLRYLHCSLCESEWNLVRAQCTNCNKSGKLDLWSLNEKLALVRAESCGDCSSYLKMMFQDKDPNVEVVADDLASIYLDMEMEAKNFLRSGVNPFIFPSEH